MPVPLLPPFSTFVRPIFHLGGSPGLVGASALKWRTFGESALNTAEQLRGINDGGFVGTEGDEYRKLINSDFPDHLTITGEAHVGVAEALSRYSSLLTEQKIAMSTLRGAAMTAHGAVNAAVVDVNNAEAACAAAVTPETQALAQANLARAQATYQSALSVWEAKKAEAQAIKDVLGAGVRAQVAAIEQQARKRFEENPSWLGEQWENIKDFVRDNSKILSLISDALQLIGGILLFIPGLNVVGAVLVGVGVGLKGLLAASGKAGWGEFFFDLATCGAVGGLAKLARAGRFGSKAAGLANRASSVAANVSSKVGAHISRGVDRVKTMFDPVDVATGAMVDYAVDVFVDGVLPLVVDRHAFSSHELGRRWVSCLDTRLEVGVDSVAMLAPDGAVLEFPAAPVDGSEVRADGRGWLLSFGDGAYRVRDVEKGVCYVFRVYECVEGDRPDEGDYAHLMGRSCRVGVIDAAAPTSGSMVGRDAPPSSVAEVFDLGVEIGLSAVVHHLGHWVEYEWDQSTGWCTGLVRSDGTRVDCAYDPVIGLISQLAVSAPGQDAQVLIRYEYNQHGQLIRVINSHQGVLSYDYDAQGRVCGWSDRNGVRYLYRFDAQGRVCAQVGSGGLMPNVIAWCEDTGVDAPAGGVVAVGIQAAGEFQCDPLVADEAMIEQYFDRLLSLPLYQAVCAHGLEAAGVVGAGRCGPRDDHSWAIPQQWLEDEFLGQLRPVVIRSTADGDV